MTEAEREEAEREEAERERDETDPQRWDGWGRASAAVALPESMAALLRGVLGTSAGPPPVALADVLLPAPDLPAGARATLEAAVGAGHVRDDHEVRVRHGAGRSTADLLRLRRGEVPAAPDAVVYPGRAEDVAEVLRICAQYRLPVVPFGGGTSVVGGLGPGPGTGPVAGLLGGPASDPRADPSADRLAGRSRHVALDLRRLDRLVAVDPVSRTATLEAGVRAPHAEALLAPHGFTLGHVPQSYEYATIGGFAATRSSGQASAGYGRFDDLVVALDVTTPAGRLSVGRVPASSTGPDLRQVFLGCEGALGVITSVTVRVRPRPVEHRYEGWRFSSFEAGSAAVRRLAQDGPLPTVLRLSDEAETAAGTGGADGCLLVAGYESATGLGGDPRPAAVAEVLAAAGGLPLGTGPGEQWRATRFAAPYLRDALLDAGAFAETLETAAFWSRLPDVYEAVRAALLEHLGRALVLCHISHVYETGASLYFTVLYAQDGETLDRWARAKAAASDAILATGGTISHHHGVGTEHRDWYTREVGPLGVHLLRAVKATLDPAGVLNPGVLLPPD